MTIYNCRVPKLNILIGQVKKVGIDESTSAIFIRFTPSFIFFVYMNFRPFCLPFVCTSNKGPFFHPSVCLCLCGFSDLLLSVGLVTPKI